jgi:hypothetical protein
VQAIDAASTVVLARTSSGISEETISGIAASGVYVVSITWSSTNTFPAKVIWDDGNGNIVGIETVDEPPSDQPGSVAYNAAFVRQGFKVLT